jgi:hypothetical protein
MLIQFCTQSYKDPSLALSAQRALNLFAEKEPPDTKTPVALFGAPGVAPFATLGTIPPASLLHTMNDIAYGIAGSQLFRINENRTADFLGSMDDLGIAIEDNGNQLIIITKQKTGWVYQLQSTSTLAAAAATNATRLSINFVNSIFIWKSGDSLKINLDNGQTYEAPFTPVALPYVGFTPVIPINQHASVGNLVNTDTITQSVNLINPGVGGSNLINVTNAAGFTVGHVVQIALDNGSTWHATITTVNPFVLIDLEPPNELPGPASIGNEVADVTPQFGKIIDPNFFPTTTVNYFDDYFVFDKFSDKINFLNGTNEFFVSALGDGFTYPGLYFASAQVNSDFVLGTLSDHEMLLIFGEKTIETWYDAGSPNFPFQRFDGATIERGIIAPATRIKEDNAVFFLGNDIKFYRLQGVNPIILSTPAIEKQWVEYNKTSKITDAFTFSFNIGGHKFIILTFPSVPATWAFDISTNFWHERDSYKDDGKTLLGRWRGNCATVAYNKILVGDILSSNIGFIDLDTYTEFGQPILFQATSVPVRSNRKRIFQPVFELEMETGVGNADAPDPQVILDFSDDQGVTYSSPMPRQLGAAGVKTVRQRWLQQGQSRLRYYRATIKDPVRKTLVAAYSESFEGM